MPRNRLAHRFREKPGTWGGPSSDHPVRWGHALPPLNSRCFIDSANFSWRLDAGSLRSLLDLCGWQSFDGPEVDATLGGLREAPENEKKALWEGWEDLATRWRA